MSNIKLDLQEVEELCYRSKRGIMTESEMIRFAMIAEIYRGNSDFENARRRGRARALGEVNPSAGADYWMRRLWMCRLEER